MSDSVGQSNEPANYYNILGLPEPQRPGEAQHNYTTLKLAYRRALLINHPDKAIVSIESRKDKELDTRSRYTIDEIVKAYETLANPQSRTAYNEYLLRANNKARLATNNKVKSVAESGLDTVDLDDLDYNESTQTWSRNCRCGGIYEVREPQLDEAGTEGVVIVGCQVCSLYIRVTFAPADN